MSLPQVNSSSPWGQSGEPSHTLELLIHMRSLQMKKPGHGGIWVEPAPEGRKNKDRHLTRKQGWAELEQLKVPSHCNRPDLSQKWAPRAEAIRHRKKAVE